MKQIMQFDFVHDTQRVFRKMLDANANPGRWEDISVEAQRAGKYGGFMAVALMLLDGETTFYADDDLLAEEMCFMTGARAAGMNEAGFVFITKKPDPALVMERARIGTLQSPHESATIIISISAEEGHTEPVQWMKARKALGLEYPMGIDLVFLREDNCIQAIPRRIEEVSQWRM